MGYPVAACRGRWAVGAEAGPTVLIYDTFTDTNGTALAAHTPDVDVVGGGWIILTGTWIITSNKAENDVGNNSIAVIDCGQANINYSATIQCASNNAQGAVIRDDAAGNRWEAAIYIANQWWTLAEYNGGARTFRVVNGGLSFVPAQYYEITGYSSGNDHHYHVSGQDSTVEYTSSQHNDHTKHGIKLGQAGFFADDFLVTTI